MDSVMIAIGDIPMRPTGHLFVRRGSRVADDEPRANRARHAAAVLFLAAALAPCLSAAPAQAQSTRTYVSGRGSDTNACTQSAPCLTLQGALAKTSSGGEIYALNSANYGYLTINKAVSIVSSRGVTGVLA